MRLVCIDAPEISQYIEGCDRETYSRLENEARLKSFGVWAVPGGIKRPWDYRRGMEAT